MEKVYFVALEAKQIDDLKVVLENNGIKDYDLNVKVYEMPNGIQVCIPTFLATEETYLGILMDFNARTHERLYAFDMNTETADRMVG